MSVEKVAPKTATNKKGDKNEREANARAKLIETASQIMREGDTIDISFSELSVRSGLNSALVKYYFGNKDGLLEAILRARYGPIFSSKSDLLVQEGHGTPEDKLRHHIGAVIDTYYAVSLSSTD